MNRVNIDYRCGERSWNALAHREEPVSACLALLLSPKDLYRSFYTDCKGIFSSIIVIYPLS
jgi:hypothetical protein